MNCCDCAIIVGGPRSPLDGVAEVPCRIACDKGLLYLQEAGVSPTLLVGDFDSYSGPLPPAVPRLLLPTAKDDTDTLAAVRWALENGYRRLSLYCALGGRLDHTLANLQTAAFAARQGAQVALYGEDTAVYVFADGSLSLPPREGYSLSVFSLTDVCEAVSLHGVRYPLDRYRMESNFPLGVSNEWAGDGPAEITVGHGVLAVMESRLS